MIGAFTLAASGLLAAAPTVLASGFHNEHITLLSSDPAQNAQPVVIATGPLHARGLDIESSTGTRSLFIFPNGTLTVLHQTGHASDTFDPVTCYGTHTETGTFRVVDGTRAYDDARGHGTYSQTVTFVGCSQTAPPQVFQLRVDASGPLAFGD
jgi:hypothetical protein